MLARPLGVALPLGGERPVGERLEVGELRGQDVGIVGSSVTSEPVLGVRWYVGDVALRRRVQVAEQDLLVVQAGTS